MTRSARGRRDNNDDVPTRGATPQRTEASHAVGGTNAGPAPGTPSGEPRRGLARLWHSFLYDRSVRARVAVLVLIPLLGALGLGSFLFWNAANDASSARAVERNATTAVLALAVASRLQDERDISGLVEAGQTGPGSVFTHRDDADVEIARLEERVAEMPDDDGTELSEAVRATKVQLNLLSSYRGSRDIELEPFDAQGADKYEQVIQALLRFVKATGVSSAESDLLNDIDTLDALARATEEASVERGLLSQWLATAAEAGEPLTEPQRQKEAILAGQQDFLLARFAVTADPEFRADYYDQMPAVRDGFETEDGESQVGVASYRNSALDSTETPGVAPTDWYEASTKRIDVMRGLQQTVAGAIVDKAGNTARTAQITAAVTALAVLLVLAMTVVLAYAVARSIIRPLRRLRSAALHAADTGLPALVARIQEDGPAVVRQVGNAVKPEGRDEIGQVASAFNDVHSTAIRVAGEQALLRQNLDTIVVNLSRRTQGLVDRQLGEIEDLESRERDPDQLGTLFRIDHLATRVRRHAESLLVLAGVEEMRRQGVAAPVLDVVRTAVGEVEQYPRIKFGVMPTDLVVPAAVDDVAHLLAELLDNATEFSAPSTAVHVTSQPLLGGGLRLQVTDTGLGIPQDQLTALNERLREPGDIDVAASRTLGIYVVARLAARHGVSVRLIPAEGTTGTVAQVDLPAHLVVSPLDTTDGVLQALQPQQPDQRPDETGPRPTSRFQGGSRADAAQHMAQPPAGQPPARRQDPATPPPPARPVAPAGPVAPALPATPGIPPGRTGAPASPATPQPAVSPPPAPRPAAPATPPAQPVSPPASQPPVPVGRSDGHQTQPIGGQNGGGMPDRQPGVQPANGSQPLGSAGNQPPTARSLRGQQPQHDDGDSPIFDAVRSAWFQKGGALDWSTPADEGWRRAAAALRSAEDAANARRGTPGQPGPTVRRQPPPATRGDAWTGGGAAGPAAGTGQPTPRPAPQRPTAPQRPSARPRPTAPQQPTTQPTPTAPHRQAAPQQPVPAPVASAGGVAGLPVRQRGATLVPGSIAAAEGETRPQVPTRPKDAGNVASTLSNLQRGVSRGREETGGWVPKRPSDSERSNS